MTYDHYTARLLHDERATRLVAEVAAHRLAREAGRPASKRTGLAAPPIEVRRLSTVPRPQPEAAADPDALVEASTDWLADRRAS